LNPLLLPFGLASAAPSSVTPRQQAVAAIKDFAGYCARGDVLWGKSLCGPLIFVEPRTREAIASANPGIDGFARDGSVWTGTLPDKISVANTAIELAGRRFAEIVLPLPDQPLDRRVLLAHESFHRIQPELGFAGREADNRQLDTRNGRIWARLEFAALKAALASKDWTGPARDALAFRAKRLALFPGAGASEGHLIANEGLAEYTGVKVGAAAEAVPFAIKRIEGGAGRASLIRSFGYVVGPAYGLLLDRISSDWRKEALNGRPLPDLLEKALPPSVGEASAAQYDEAAIIAEETARDAHVQKRRRSLVAELVDGPVVTFPASNLNLDFDPNTLFSLGDHGTVYSRATVVRDAWGVLTATGDVLLSPGWGYARVQGPATAQGDRIVGPGWSAELAPGYFLTGDQKSGNFIIRSRKSRPQQRPGNFGSFWRSARAR
jgi:hypothetical protein